MKISKIMHVLIYINSMCIINDFQVTGEQKQIQYWNITASSMQDSMHVIVDTQQSH